MCQMYAEWRFLQQGQLVGLNRTRHLQLRSIRLPKTRRSLPLQNLLLSSRCGCLICCSRARLVGKEGGVSYSKARLELKADEVGKCFSRVSKLPRRPRMSGVWSQAIGTQNEEDPDTATASEDSSNAPWTVVTSPSHKRTDSVEATSRPSPVHEEPSEAAGDEPVKATPQAPTKTISEIKASPEQVPPHCCPHSTPPD